MMNIKELELSYLEQELLNLFNKMGEHKIRRKSVTVEEDQEATNKLGELMGLNKKLKSMAWVGMNKRPDDYKFDAMLEEIENFYRPLSIKAIVTDALTEPDLSGQRNVIGLLKTSKRPSAIIDFIKTGEFTLDELKGIETVINLVIANC
ncbi:hypothetical protein EFA69_06500 [Rufibacter immobilis]|uniref:Uncharacterized protein n=1 Tax=Rufibacter immobilis TaxID=1348778 RepID=A0A3M9N0L4_9BACT|nr:hypothetical protein [Rufibacter immobilis]RNI30937.1 hypothetical protein EFA69_06500 [Rufibacter immobilis]